MNSNTILVTGANGQLGTVLTEALRLKFGRNNVIASDIHTKSISEDPFEVLDATNYQALEQLVMRHKVTQIYHLAAILSATGEQTPLKTWEINMKTFLNVLEISRLRGVEKVFFPSSIAVYGSNIQRIKTPQEVNLSPTTVYGMSKVAGENWAKYYHERYGLDIRSVRYPGVITYQSLPGGGTTDYAVDIYHKAVQHKPFKCFLKPTTQLPMMYIDDAIRATLELMEAPREMISVRTSYNLAAMSFSPEEVAASIQHHYPDFKISYHPDFRQAIADTWPISIDDSQASADWGWSPAYSLESMTRIMIENLTRIPKH